MAALTPKQVDDLFDELGKLLPLAKRCATGEHPVSEIDTLAWIATHAGKVAEMVKQAIVVAERRGQ